MALIVQKYGGTSVADPERMRSVARRVVQTLEAGNRVAVVEIVKEPAVQALFPQRLLNCFQVHRGAQPGEFRFQYMQKHRPDARFLPYPSRR